MFLIERNLFGILVTTITSKRFLVKFEFSTSFAYFQFCCCFAELFVFEQVSGAFKRFSPSLVKNIFVRKKLLCFLVMKTISKLFSVCFNSF